MTLDRELAQENVVRKKVIIVYCFDVHSDGTISEKELKRLIKDMFMMIKEENPEEVGF